MSAHRSQAVPERGQRVVLIWPGATRAEEQRRLAAALDEVGRLGWTLTAVIDPQQHRDALRMVGEGLADVVVAVRQEDLPSLYFAWHLGNLRSTPAGQRTQLLPRPERFVVDPWRQVGDVRRARVIGLEGEGAEELETLAAQGKPAPRRPRLIEPEAPPAPVVERTERVSRSVARRTRILRRAS